MLSSSAASVRKAKISLNDYSFQRDIKLRLFMADLKAIEVDVLREIVHHSLKISIEQLADDLGIEPDALLPILDKLSVTKLFTRQHKILIVDKDIRKYFETEIEKFDEDFRPDVDFLQTILSKVPLHVTLTWYAIPRTSDNIFDSIIEKYLLTPKIYRQYLSELQFDDPILNSIIKDIHQPPHFMISTHDLMVKFNLTHKCLEEYLLLLEYHFACCLTYKKIEGSWKEVVTPFAEWRDFLEFDYQSKPQPIPLKSVTKNFPVEFAFVKDLVTMLQACQSNKIASKNIKNLHASTTTQKESLVNKLLQLELVKQDNSNQLSATKKGKEWVAKPFFEQVATLGNDPLNTLTAHDDFSELWNLRNLSLIEKNLRRLTPQEWISFENFLQGFIAPIGNNDVVTLKNKRKKWQYILPTYTDLEKTFVEAVIMERLAELGMIETGSYQNKPCFCLTPFGYNVVH